MSLENSKWTIYTVSYCHFHKISWVCLKFAVSHTLSSSTVLFIYLNILCISPSLSPSPWHCVWAVNPGAWFFSPSSGQSLLPLLLSLSPSVAFMTCSTKIWDTLPPINLCNSQNAQGGERGLEVGGTVSVVKWFTSKFLTSHFCQTWFLKWVQKIPFWNTLGLNGCK